MCAAGLNINTLKCILGLKDIPYLGYLITRKGVKPGPNKLQGVIDLGQPTTMTEAKALIVMVQYYRDMWPRRSHVLAPLKEAARGPKSGKILFNDALEESFKELKIMVSADTSLSYPYFTIHFTVNIDASDR